MNKDNFDKLGELIAIFTKDCNSIGFEVLGAKVENTIELEIRAKNERHLDVE